MSYLSDVCATQLPLSSSILGDSSAFKTLGKCVDVDLFNERAGNYLSRRHDFGDTDSCNTENTRSSDDDHIRDSTETKW